LEIWISLHLKTLGVRLKTDYKNVQTSVYEQQKYLSNFGIYTDYKFFFINLTQGEK